MEPPAAKNNAEIFPKRVPKQNPVIPPIRGLRPTSKFGDPFAETSYPVARTDRGKSFSGLGAPRTEAKTFRQGTQSYMPGPPT